ncbi:MAG: ABC-F family ATP-binding cassette domain-containing protein [Elusimicrobiaceae bacterium]|nr:ABC-F family ATP-binding cassette domain-containing protein [Elusimicrobiaceae bacterium]
MSSKPVSFIRACDVSYSFEDGNSLFNRLRFSIPGGITGLVGPNGAGKSTLLRLISGELKPSAGKMEIKGGTAFLRQTAPFSGAEPVGEALGVAQQLAAYARMKTGDSSPELLDRLAGAWDIENAVSSALAATGAAHIALDRKFGTLSGGEAMKIRLAGLLLSNADILLLDEPTNNLDLSGRQAVTAFLRGLNKCAVVASHDRQLLGAADRILELSSRGLAVYGGNYEFYAAARRTEDEALDRRIAAARETARREKRELRENRERQVHRMANGRKKADRGGLPKILAGKRKRRAQETLGRNTGRDSEILARAEAELSAVRAQTRARNAISVDLPLTEVPNGKPLVRAENLNFRYPQSGRFVFEKGLTFEISGPARIALAGPNGSGKSTLLDLIVAAAAGRAFPGAVTGALTVYTSRIACLDQKTGLLRNDLTLLENITRFAPGLKECDRRLRLARFLFQKREIARKAETLSGGERIRAALACAFSAAEPPQLLILDEPANNLDLDSMQRLESALSNFKGALLAVSHDEKFLENIGADGRIETRERA